MSKLVASIESPPRPYTKAALRCSTELAFRSQFQIAEIANESKHQCSSRLECTLPNKRIHITRLLERCMPRKGVGLGSRSKGFQEANRVSSSSGQTESYLALRCVDSNLKAQLQPHNRLPLKNCLALLQGRSRSKYAGEA